MATIKQRTDRIAAINQANEQHDLRRFRHACYLLAKNFQALDMPKFSHQMMILARSVKTVRQWERNIARADRKSTSIKLF